jgi:hypothetical protein
LRWTTAVVWDACKPSATCSAGGNQERKRHFVLQLGVLSLVDDTHATLAELLDYAVMADAGADDQDRGIVPSWDLRKVRQERR